MPKRLTSSKAKAIAFGRFARQIRNARGLTQESLAETAGLSADTIRRLEHGDFSPSLDTLTKFARGARVDLGTLMMAFELNELGDGPELVAMARSLTRAERLIALRILAVLADLVAPLGEGSDADG